MVGLLYPDEGDVLVHGESVPNMADDDLFEMRKKFGVLFQDGALFGSMNLFDNVAFPLRQHTDKGEDEIGDIVNRRLKEVGLGGAGDKMPNELSGGMRKRAGFARALVLDPQIVLFDEPDSGLDPVRTALLCELIQEIHEENGGAYVVITHDIMSRAARGRVHRDPVEGPDRRVGPGVGALQLRQPVRTAVPLRRGPRPARDGVSAQSTLRGYAGSAPPGGVRMRRWEAGALFETRTWLRHKLHRLTTSDPGRVRRIAARTDCRGRPRRGRNRGRRGPALRRRHRSYTVYATFQNAGQLVNGNQVEVGGRPIGTISDIELTDDGRARVKMELDDYTPLHVGTRATIRANSLSGIAGRYIALDLGPNSAAGDRGRRRDRRRATSTAPVDLDQLFDTLDTDTRAGLQKFVKGSAEQIDGKVAGGAREPRLPEPGAVDDRRAHARDRLRPADLLALRHGRLADGRRDRRAPRRPGRPRRQRERDDAPRSATRTPRSRARSTSCPTRCATRTRRS